MNITNGCVTLRAIEERDFDILFRMMKSERIEKAMGHCTMPISEKNQKDWMQNYKNTEEQIRLMIELSNGKTIGVVMLFDIDMHNGTAEIGYKTDASKEDRIEGDVSDALNGLIEFAFNYLRLNCIYAKIPEGNFYSERAIQRVGFLKEGILRQRIYQEGKYLNMLSFSITKEDFINRG